ncbi:DUF6485 family protein [Desulfobotulus alkaliphilus]|uniref:DUF6485 family protein n=1 Tax=Desulfobotulus alkaliphilus TaxID=622671 RepID=UPI0011A0B71C|nr:DUF6485 family protein [Desulfobotulus alkaliphilus]
MECNQEENKKSCACTYPGCPRQGNCCACIRYHRGKGQLPACVFPADAEKTYDRSFKHFARLVAEGRV